MIVTLHNQFSKILYYILLSIAIHIIVILIFYIVYSFQRITYEEVEVNFSQTLPFVMVAPPRQVIPQVQKPEILNDTIEITEEEEELIEEEPVIEEPPPEVEVSPDAEEVYEPFYAVDTRPTFLIQEELTYPFLEKRKGIEGVVIIEIDINSKGVMKGYRIIKSAGENFDQAAIDMVTKSTYNPGIKDGRTIAVRMRLTVRFQLD